MRAPHLFLCEKQTKLCLKAQKKSLQIFERQPFYFQRITLKPRLSGFDGTRASPDRQNSQ